MLCEKYPTTTTTWVLPSRSAVRLCLCSNDLFNQEPYRVSVASSLNAYRFHYVVCHVLVVLFVIHRCKGKPQTCSPARKLALQPALREVLRHTLFGQFVNLDVTLLVEQRAPRLLVLVQPLRTSQQELPRKFDAMLKTTCDAHIRYEVSPIPGTVGMA